MFVHNMQQARACLPMAARFFSLSFLMLISTPLLSDVVIELTNGKKIVVPVDKQEVERIVFTDKSPQLATERSLGRTWQVGPDREMKNPSEAAKRAKDGDIVEIDSGTYHNDYAVWRQNNLTIRGIGGMAHLKSKGFIPNGKAIWIMKGDTIVIEKVEFSGAMVKDTNGAGLRLEGGDLILRSTFFHDNEFSILGAGGPDASLEIIASRFWFQKRKERYSHGLYIGALKRFTLIGSHVKGTDQGHQVKSRAFENHIMYNRIEDVSGGNSSRLIDLPNCGLSFVVGNDLHQGISTGNNNLIGYGAEKCAQRGEREMKLYVVNNTVVNEASNGVLVNNHAGGDILVSNNLLFGAGKFLSGDGVESNNIRLGISQRQAGSWAPPSGSAAIDGARNLPPVEGGALVPTREFDLPVGSAEREQNGPVDIGSREQAER
ncbi:MAG: hypothetical protein V7709_19605 [Halioglobus sp.]